MIHIDNIDHLVMTVADIDVTSRFYQQVLGMEQVAFGEGRVALQFGRQKINLHALGHEFAPKAHLAAAGTLDLCLISSTPMDQIVEHLAQCQVPLLEGPVRRTGATGPILSVYFRDPDLNLIEVANLLSE